MEGDIVKIVGGLTDNRIWRIVHVGLTTYTLQSIFDRGTIYVEKQSNVKVLVNFNVKEALLIHAEQERGY